MFFFWERFRTGLIDLSDDVKMFPSHMFGENFVTDCDIVKCNAAYEHFFCVVYNILRINFCVSIKSSLMVKSKQVVQEQSVHFSSGSKVSARNY